MEFNAADIFEGVVDRVPDREAIVHGSTRLTYKELDARSNKAANALKKLGIKKGSHIGIYAFNCVEWLEIMLGAYKLCAIPININYRYVEEELKYLIDNADMEAIFYHKQFSNKLENIKSHLPLLKDFICIEDDSGEDDVIDKSFNFEDLIANEDESRLDVDRSGDDKYILYTGGTTGMPKGVMYQHEGHLMGMMNTAGAWGLIPVQERLEKEDLESIGDEVKRLADEDNLPVSIPACPLMHGTGMWLGAIIPHLVGGTVVTLPQLGFDPDNLLKEVERTKANNVVIVGDAFAKPIMDALDKAESEGKPYNLESVNTVISSGVMWSSEVKQGLLKHHDMVLVDAMGSTEGGMGSSRASRDNPAETAKFVLNPGVIVITDDGEIVEPGSDKMGKIGTSGLVPLGYFKDEKKSAETFKEFEGVRYSFPGDYAKVEADGTITLLGRGSNCINTAGEKVYPEEVEEAIKRHDDIYDCLVVGLQDDRFGQRVVALASFQEGKEVDEQDLISFTREHLAGYKLPKQVLFVDEVMRAPNGKANYKWAKETAEQELT